ncbi:ABC-2 family transporter protein [Candidatus Daviesbacteria bacterium]|nr:ABC-2 family transporter protein [Candidatus Daviesbacteria bacterium]
MKKYFQIFKISWQQNLTYRLNFILWRIRTILQLLLVYFIWWTVFQTQANLFGYTKSLILTYILVAALIRVIVLSTRVTDLINQINDGSVVNFIVKPLGFIRYYLSVDFADKIFNILFFVFEIIILFIFFKPPLIIQTNIFTVGLFLLAIAAGLLIYFCINLLISLSSFWTENSWGPLFLMTIILEGFGGGLFPIDILPKNIFNILMLTPFPYLIYFPAKIYLGTMPVHEILFGFMTVSVWGIVLIMLMQKMIKVGFKHFSAVGN